MAENKTGIGGLYSSGYGPYMTRTDAQFVRRPAQNFMTGQNLQNPPLDIFDVTMNPDQFFGGSGTGTFNQQFEGSVRRPGLGSGNPNLGDPTFGGGTVPGGGGAGNTGGGGSGGSGGGGGGGGGGDGGVIIGPGPGGGGGVDLELPVVKGPGTGEQILGLLVGAGVSAGMTKLIDKLSKGEEITPADTEDLTIEEQTKINEALNQTGYEMSDKLTDVIDSKVNPIIENNIETKFEEDLYDNLDPDEGLVTDVDGNVIGASDFTDLDNLIGGGNIFTDGTGRVTVEEDVAGTDQIKKLQELRDAGFDASTSFDILDSLALGSLTLDDYNSLVDVTGATTETGSTSNETTFEGKRSSNEIDLDSSNYGMDEFGNFYDNAGNLVTGVASSLLSNAANVGNVGTGITQLVSSDGLSSTFAGVKDGVNLGNQATGALVDFGSAVDNAEYIMGGFQESTIGLLGPDKYAWSYDLDKYVTEDEFIKMGGKEAQEIIASDLPEEAATESGGMFDFLSKGGGDVAGYKGGLNVGEGISVGLSALQLGKAIKDGDAVGMASGTLGIITTLAGIGGLPGIAIGMAPALMQMALGGPEPYTVGTEATVRDDGYVDVKPVYDGGREIDTVKTLVGSADKVNSIIFQAKLEGIDVGINDEGAKAISDATTFTSMPGGKKKSGVGYVGQQIEELGGSDAVATNALMKAIEVGGVTGDVEAFAEIVNREKPDAFDEGGWGKLNNQIDLINNAVDSGLIPDATRNYGKPDNVVGYRNPDLNNIWDDAGTSDDFSDDELIFAAPFSSQALSQAPGLQNISLGSDEEVAKFNAMIEANRQADDITEVIANLQGAGYDGFADYFVDELDKRNEGSI